MRKYGHLFTEDDEQFVLNNQQHIISLAKDNGIELTEEASCLFVFLRTPAVFQDFANNEQYKIIYELAMLLLTLIDANEKGGFLKVSSGNTSCKIQENRLIKHLRAKIDEELSFWHTQFINALGFPEKNLCPLYSEEQVTKIANSIQKNVNKGKLVVKDLSLPFVIDYIVSQFKAKGVFDKNSKYLKTDEAVFIYDVLGLFDVLPKKWRDDEAILNDKDKYQKIKEYLRTIEKRGKE